jgi:tyrosinase
VFLRKNIRNIDNKDLLKIRNAIRDMMSRIDNQGYGYIAGEHGWPGKFCKHEPENDDLGRRIDPFLPWHRAYLYNFEKLMQERLDGELVGLPWWDWHSPATISEGIPKSFSDESVDNKPNPLFNFHMNFKARDDQGREVTIDRETKRNPKPPGVLAEYIRRFHMQLADIPDLYSLQDFSQFSERLRIGWHNSIHNWVGGDMGIVAFAAYDPIFWIHHCNIDRIWAIWQTRNGIHNIAHHMDNVVLRPFGMTVKDVLNINSLGYEYASSTSS